MSSRMKNRVLEPYPYPYFYPPLPNLYLPRTSSRPATKHIT